MEPDSIIGVIQRFQNVEKKNPSGAIYGRTQCKSDEWEVQKKKNNNNFSKLGDTLQFNVEDSRKKQELNPGHFDQQPTVLTTEPPPRP